MTKNAKFETPNAIKMGKSISTQVGVWNPLSNCQTQPYGQKVGTNCPPKCFAVEHPDSKCQPPFSPRKMVTVVVCLVGSQIDWRCIASHTALLKQHGPVPMRTGFVPTPDEKMEVDSVEVRLFPGHESCRDELQPWQWHYFAGQDSFPHFIWIAVDNHYCWRY